MKEHFERYLIFYLIGVMFVIGIVVLVAAYIPTVGTKISDDNADWGDFGAFFWGFGTMCFTMMNVIVFYAIYQRLYRKEIYDIYRDAFNSLLNAYVPQNERSNDEDEVEFSAEIAKGLINITCILGGIRESSSYNDEVERYASKLMNDGATFSRQRVTKGEFRKFISELAGFQICLITNKVTRTYA